MRILVLATAAAVLVGGCSSSSSKKPDVVRITDPDVAKSPVASQFITDLYEADHGSYWRSKDQPTLMATAGIYCVERGSPAGQTDLAADFTGLATSGIQEFESITKRDICVYVDKPGHRIPGYQG